MERFELRFWSSRFLENLIEILAGVNEVHLIESQVSAPSNLLAGSGALFCLSRKKSQLELEAGQNCK